MKHVIIGVSTATILLAGSFVQATVPNVFNDGEPAIAAEVNENFTNLDSRVTAIEGGSVGGANTITIAVDCDNGGSVNNSIAEAASSNHLFVNISGTCNERVVITRSNISLLGSLAASTSINFVETPLSSFHTSLNANDLGNAQGTINVLGAQNIIIDNLTITGAITDPQTGESGKGVAVRFNGSALIQNSTITGNLSGISTNTGGSAVLSNNNINGNLAYGIIATDGGLIRLLGGNTISQTGPRAGSSANSAIGAYRNGSINVLGVNTVTASPSTDNAAIEMYYGSQFRSYYGLLTVNGSASVGYDSQINYRDTNHTGDIFVLSKGSFRLQNTNQTTSGVTVTGDAYVGTLGLLTTSGNTTFNGNVTCSQNSSYASISGTITGIVTDC